jgi:hypothetical protein
LRNFGNRKEVKKCLMDMVEDLEEGEEDGDSVSEEALLLGLMLAWEGEDCRDVVISSVELSERLSCRIMGMAFTTVVPLCVSMEFLILISEPVPILPR